MSTHKHFDKICCVVLIAALVLTVFLMNLNSEEVQSSPKTMGYEEKIFSTSTVHNIDILMDNWDEFIQNCKSEEYYACTAVIDNEVYKNIAIRAKGNTSLTQVESYGNQRYSFKIEFDHYDSSKLYHGLDKLCLNNIIQDNTYMKDYLSYQMMNELGVASPLCSFTYITVNGEDWGLYLAVEGIEESFLQRNYGSNYGELYKPDSSSMGNDKRENTEQFPQTDGNHDLSDQMPTIPDDSSNSTDTPATMPDGDSNAFGNPPSMPDGDSNAFGNPPSMPDGDANSFGNPPSMPDGDANSFGNPPSMPDGDEDSFGNPPSMPEGDADSFGNPPSMPEGDADSLGSPLSMPGGDSDSLSNPLTMPSGDSDSSTTSGSQENTDQPFQKEQPQDKGKGGGGGMNSSDDVLLKYIDDDADSYSNIFDNAKTDITASDETRLIQALKNLSEQKNLSETVDVERVIRYFVAHNFVLNFDSYTGSMIHNYYLYEKNGQMQMIPWDYNLAFGGFLSDDATTLVNYPIDSPVSGGNTEDRPMIAWIFENETYTEMYHQYFQEFIAEYFDSGYFSEMIDTVTTMISPYVEKDPTKFCTFEEFQTGISTLKEFCLLRAESVKAQLNGTIGSTTTTQDQNTLVDASHIKTSDMGSMNVGFGGEGEKEHPTKNSSDFTQSEDMQKNSEDIQKNSEDMQQIPEDMQQNSEDIQQNSEDIQQNSEGIQQNSEGMQKIPEDMQQNSEGMQKKPDNMNQLRTSTPGNNEGSEWILLLGSLGILVFGLVFAMLYRHKSII